MRTGLEERREFRRLRGGSVDRVGAELWLYQPQ